MLALMRSDAYLINTARGGLIDEDALEEALRAGRIAGAALDVRGVEPPNDNRFAQFANVVLTPHIASITLETRRAMYLMAAENVVRVLRGERPHGLINPEVWDRVAGTQR
jgi:phosphoglycerate dehydrogenase-like enzyme